MIFFYFVVLPVVPSNLQFPDISSTHARLTWELTNQNEDDRPDNLTAQLYYKNRTMALEYIVNGTETELNLDLVPGMEYIVQIISANIDGKRRTEEIPFKSVDGRKFTNLIKYLTSLFLSNYPISLFN